MYKEILKDGEYWKKKIEEKVENILSIKYINININLMDRKDEYMNSMN
jgi:hypothetical protein